MALRKCTDVPNETEWVATMPGIPVSGEDGTTVYCFPQSTGIGRQVALAAELAGVCRQACQESRQELEAHAQNLAQASQCDARERAAQIDV